MHTAYRYKSVANRSALDQGVGYMDRGLYHYRKKSSGTNLLLLATKTSFHERYEKNCDYQPSTTYLITTF